jgi:hypothetical protein
MFHGNGCVRLSRDVMLDVETASLNGWKASLILCGWFLCFPIDSEADKM